MAATILAADDDPSILRLIEVNLRLEGFDVVLASDGRQAMELAFAAVPDLILLDLGMPGVDGLEVLRHLRADTRTASTPVIILTGRALVSDKVDGLSAGADDYVVKPFDAVELLARVRTALRRARDLRAVSPLTGLPGNHVIMEQLSLRMARAVPTAVLYADLKNFKSFNDRYGFHRGDGVLQLVAGILRRVVDARPGTFLGHVGGDDFVVIADPADVESICRQAIVDFDAAIAAHYDPEDAERGYIDQLDRQGIRQRFPLLSIAIGVASSGKRPYAHPGEMVEVATEMRMFVKRQLDGSGFAVDERRSDAGHLSSGAVGLGEADAGDAGAGGVGPPAWR